MKNAFLIVILAFVISQVSLAQSQTTGSGLIGFRRGLATVMLSGLGGAVLGLSTLSFYGDPQEHIGNIWAGLALGALGGTAYVLTQSQSQNQNNMALDPFPVSTRQRLALQRPPLFQYSWNF